MKFKKQILSILISTFVFMAMHDFIIGHIDTDTQAELYIHNMQNTPMCESSVLHEMIHMTLIGINQIRPFFDYSLSNTSLINDDILDRFISGLPCKLYRPPIV